MKATEFRIGNLIRFISTNEIEQIVEIESNIKTPLINNVHITDVDHIPLTEEWLLKFGFKFEVKIEYAFGINDVSYYNLDKIRIGIDDSGKTELYYNYQQAIVQIKHVHQLQNLFYSLTGTELLLAKNKTSTDDSLETKS